LIKDIQATPAKNTAVFVYFYPSWLKFMTSNRKAGNKDVTQYADLPYPVYNIIIILLPYITFHINITDSCGSYAVDKAYNTEMERLL